MLPRLPPALEWLEGRLAPATLPAAPVEQFSAPVQIAVFEPTAADFARSVVLPTSPYQVFATAAVAVGTPTGSTQFFFSTPAQPDAQLNLIGRLPQASFKFPPSGGGGGEVVKREELGYLVPAVAPADAEQGAGDGEGKGGDGEGESKEPPPVEVEKA